MSNQNFVTVHTKIVQNLVFTDFLVIYVQNSRFFAFLLNFFERYFITVFLKIYRTVFEKRFTISDTKYLSNLNRFQSVFKLTINRKSYQTLLA